jgi:hypothetical protein
LQLRKKQTSKKANYGLGFSSKQEKGSKLVTAYRCEKEGEEEDTKKTKKMEETKRPCPEWMSNPADRLA